MNDVEKKIFIGVDSGDANKKALMYFHVNCARYIHYNVLSTEEGNYIIEAWKMTDEEIKKMDEPNPKVDEILRKIREAEEHAPKCPTCGSKNLSKVGNADKMISVFFFGLFSQKVKKQFHCNNCGYEW